MAKRVSGKEGQKVQLLKALEQIDSGKKIVRKRIVNVIEKKGLVRMRVLINLLECMDFKLLPQEMQTIRQQF